MFKRVKLPKTLRTNSCYLTSVYDVDSFKVTVERVLEQLRKMLGDRKTHFDAIAFRGSSGAALAYIASATLGIPLMHVRKPTESNHFGSSTEGVYGVETYIIIDDFIATGSTVKAIIEGVTGMGVGGKPPKLIGMVLYNSSNYPIAGTYDEARKCMMYGSATTGW